MAKDKWIQKAINPSHKGKLHEALGISKDKKISMGKIKKAEKSKNLTLRKEAQLAETLKKLHKR